MTNLSLRHVEAAKRLLAFCQGFYRATQDSDGYFTKPIEFGGLIAFDEMIRDVEQEIEKQRRIKMEQGEA